MPEELAARYTIVGAGIAGVTAAEAIRELDPTGEILLVNGEETPPYCRPLIVDVLKGEKDPDDIYLRPAEWYREKKVELVSGDPAVRLEPPEKRIRLASGRAVRWEKLLLATGGKPAEPPIEGLDRIRVFNLHHHDDVEMLRLHCRHGTRTLVVGIGLVGLQAMTALHEMGNRVIAVEMMPKVLPLILDARAAQYAERRMLEAGVELHVGTGVRKVTNPRGGSHDLRAHTEDGSEILFDHLILATGVMPDLSLLDGVELERDRGIKVSPHMETSVPDVFAAGDITECDDEIEGRPEIHAHWVNAYHQGRIAGRRMAGGDARTYEPMYLNSLDVFGMAVITMGASRIDQPEGAEVLLKEAPSRPSYARLVVRGGRLEAATFINEVERAGVFQYLMREKVEIGEAAQALLEEDLGGTEFLQRLHRQAVRGEVDWPASMDLIKKFKKDHSRTRWGDKEKGKA